MGTDEKSRHLLRSLTAESIRAKWEAAPASAVVVLSGIHQAGADLFKAAENAEFRGETIHWFDIEVALQRLMEARDMVVRAFQSHV